MRLRIATPADVTALTTLWYDGWQIGHATIAPPALIHFRDRPSFRERIEQALHSFWVAERDGSLVGFVRIVGEELDQFYVAPALIGQGVAPPLMRAAEDLLRRKGVYRAFLVATEGNNRAIRFYEKQGWENCGRRLAEVTTREGPFRLWVNRFEKTLADRDVATDAGQIGNV